MLFGRVLDPPLDPPGEQQAQQVAASVAAFPDLVIHASPRRRTQQTAAAIAAQSHSEVTTVLDLDEVDFGAWGGRTFADLAEDPGWRRWNEARCEAQTPAGDSMPAVQQRVMRHLRHTARDFPAHTVAIVTHAEIIRAVLLDCFAAPLASYHRIEISPASLTTLSIDRDRVVVHSVNERVRT